MVDLDCAAFREIELGRRHRPLQPVSVRPAVLPDLERTQHGTGRTRPSPLLTHPRASGMLLPRTWVHKLVRPRRPPQITMQSERRITMRACACARDVTPCEDAGVQTTPHLVPRVAALRRY